MKALIIPFSRSWYSAVCGGFVGGACGLAAVMDFPEPDAGNNCGTIVLFDICFIAGAALFGSAVSTVTLWIRNPVAASVAGATFTGSLASCSLTNGWTRAVSDAQWSLLAAVIGFGLLTAGIPSLVCRLYGLHQVREKSSDSR